MIMKRINTRTRLKMKIPPTKSLVKNVFIFLLLTLVQIPLLVQVAHPQLAMLFVSRWLEMKLTGSNF